MQGLNKQESKTKKGSIQKFKQMHILRLYDVS